MSTSSTLGLLVSKNDRNNARRKSFTDNPHWRDRIVDEDSNLENGQATVYYLMQDGTTMKTEGRMVNGMVRKWSQAISVDRDSTPFSQETAGAN